MNEDRIEGASRDIVGKAERGLGEAVGSERLKGDGVVDQVTGSIQHGYGQIKDALADAIDDTPAAISETAGRIRDLGRKGDGVVRDRLGDNGSVYVLAGVIGLLAFGAFVLTRSSPAKAPAPTPKRTRAKRRS